MSLPPPLPPDVAPPAPKPKSLRMAFTLNFMLPGLGQLYMGQIGLGLLYSLSFAACFVAMIAIFLRAYSQYLQLATSGNLLDGDNLDHLATAFPTKWLIALLIIALIIFFASLIGLGLSRKDK